MGNQLAHLGKNSMLILFFAYYLIMTHVPEWMDSAPLYWLLDSVFRVALIVYVFKHVKKNVVNLFGFVSCLIVFIYDTIDSLLLVLGYTPQSLFSWLVSASIALIVWYAITHKRYQWRRLKSDSYDPTKVQAIYSKPNELITVLGSSISLSAKCSVRYSYNGKTIRFRKGYPTPVLTKTVIQESDIIENTKIDTESFYKRFDEIKENKFNLIKFNCKHIFKEAYNKTRA